MLVVPLSSKIFAKIICHMDVLNVNMWHQKTLLFATLLGHKVQFPKEHYSQFGCEVASQMTIDKSV